MPKNPYLNIYLSPTLLRSMSGLPVTIYLILSIVYTSSGLWLSAVDQCIVPFSTYGTPFPVTCVIFLHILLLRDLWKHICSVRPMSYFSVVLLVVFPCWSDFLVFYGFNFYLHFIRCNVLISMQVLSIFSVIFILHFISQLLCYILSCTTLRNYWCKPFY